MQVMTSLHRKRHHRLTVDFDWFLPATCSVAPSCYFFAAHSCFMAFFCILCSGPLLGTMPGRLLFLALHSVQVIVRRGLCVSAQ